MKNCEFCEFLLETRLASGIVYNHQMGVILPLVLAPTIVLGALNKLGPYAACQKHIEELGDILGVTESYGRPN